MKGEFTISGYFKKQARSQGGRGESFFRNNTPKMYFAAETGYFNLYVRPIPKYDFQR